MRRFFYPTLNTLKVGTNFVLSDDNHQHWCKVLRAQVGDEAVFFDGTGGEYKVRLNAISKKDAHAHVFAFDPINRTNTYHTTLIQAISANDKMDYTIQKACEMGVNIICPVISERSEQLKYAREQKKHAHWQKIAISACEQCGLNIVPTICQPTALTEVLQADKSRLKLVLDLHPSPALPCPLPTSISLLVGAEGGLNPSELEVAYDLGFLSLNLGERVLRTETASVVAMATLGAVMHSQSINPL